jgi:hypothetical protein
MMQHIKIHTEFDITNTGVVRNYKASNMPCTIGGKLITTESEWMKLRRQQTNWETLIQLISLRTQPMNIQTSIKKKFWTLEFDVEKADVYLKDDDPLGLLKEDCECVPMLTGLDEHKDLDQSAKDNITTIRFETYEL